MLLACAHHNVLFCCQAHLCVTLCASSAVLLMPVHTVSWPAGLYKVHNTDVCMQNRLDTSTAPHPVTHAMLNAMLPAGLYLLTRF